MKRAWHNLPLHGTIVALWLFAGLAFAGCLGCGKPQHVSRNDALSSSSVARAQAHGESALVSVIAAVPHTDSTGKVYLIDARDDLEAQKYDHAAAQSAIARAQAERSQMQTERDEWKRKYADEIKHWFGYQLRLWGKVVTVVAILGYLAAGLTAALLPAGGLGSFLIRFIPLGNPFAFLRDKVVKPVA